MEDWELATDQEMAEIERRLPWDVNIQKSMGEGLTYEQLSTRVKDAYFRETDISDDPDAVGQNIDTWMGYCDEKGWDGELIDTHLGLA